MSLLSHDRGKDTASIGVERDPRARPRDIRRRLSLSRLMVIVLSSKRRDSKGYHTCEYSFAISRYEIFAIILL